jgi:flagellar operon protein (TIGR03826 family)
MNLRNCPECGRVFSYVGRNLCPKCLEKEEEEYMTVRRYVRDHRGASILEVADATGIEEEKILQFLRDGRLESGGFSVALECERCGRKIGSGRYCSDCLAQMDAQIRGAVTPKNKVSTEKPAPGSRNRERMYIKNNNNNS